MLTQHGLLGFAAAVVAKLAWFVVLEVALWCVGVGPDVLPPSAVLAAMAVVGIVSLVPITPGAVGVTEVAYIGILSSVAGSGMTEQLTAAVMLFRIAQWLVPIPIGWVLLLVMRRGHWGELLGGPDDGSDAVLEADRVRVDRSEWRCSRSCRVQDRCRVPNGSCSRPRRNSFCGRTPGCTSVVVDLGGQAIGLWSAGGASPPCERTARCRDGSCHEPVTTCCRVRVTGVEEVDGQAELAGRRSSARFGT